MTETRAVVLPELDLPLFRKVMEWVVAQKALPKKEREWDQTVWRSVGEARGRSCGTVYCVAGYTCEVMGAEWLGARSHLVRMPAGYTLAVNNAAQQLLGLTMDEADRLFNEDNNFKDVMRVAREICRSRGLELGL